jgi:hypothetical protein
MRRLARCLLAALLAAAFASPVYASPPPVLAPVVTVALAPMRASAIALPAQAAYHRLDPVVAPVAVGVLPTPTVAEAQAYALAVLGATQYNCLYLSAFYESKWNPRAWNGKGSGAYGIPQAKPGSKMASFGADWETNPETQVRWMIWYTTTKYGSPCGAEAFRRAHGWY